VYHDTPRSTEQWTYLLSISNKFKLEKVHKRAITALERTQLDPVDKIDLAVKHDVPEWLDPAYIELCKREDPLREEEAEKVGLNTTVKLYRAREKVRAENKGYRCCQNCASTTRTYCDACCSWVSNESLSAAPQTFNDARIGEVIASIFHPAGKADPSR
jgi:hypothetical protein